MDLPLVLDIAIGLIFIYLILSLLTSEIQELIAILLQWRAEHLKRSIETLLSGGNIDDLTYRKFTDKLYDSPLIKALNQEAKGLLAVSFRKLFQSVSTLYRRLARTRNIFSNQTSGPSYIPSSTFSIAILQSIKIEALSQKISELVAEKFCEEKLILLRGLLDDLSNSIGYDSLLVGSDSLLEVEFKKLEKNLKNSVQDFVSGRANLSGCYDAVTEQFILFIDNTEALIASNHYCKEIVRTRLAYLKQAIARRQLEPTVTEVLRLVFNSPVHTNPSPWLRDIVERLKRDQPELLSHAADLPDPLKQNILCLAEQARLKAKSLDEEVRQLEQEIADWFDRSMDRASGVYRRNAKGVAILIGFGVAIAINADTLFIVGRLSKDTVLRSTISHAADEIVLRTASSPPSATAAPPILPATGSLNANLKEVKEAVTSVLDEVPLPIGWNPVNVQQQEAESQGWSVPMLKRLMGWFVTGIALSMGSSFWYDLLGKVIRVRATGNRPGESK